MWRHNMSHIKKKYSLDTNIENRTDDCTIIFPNHGYSSLTNSGTLTHYDKSDSPSASKKKDRITNYT